MEHIPNIILILIGIFVIYNIFRLEVYYRVNATSMRARRDYYTAKTEGYNADKWNEHTERVLQNAIDYAKSMSTDTDTSSLSSEEEFLKHATDYIEYVEPDILVDITTIVVKQMLRRKLQQSKSFDDLAGTIGKKLLKL